MESKIIEIPETHGHEKYRLGRAVEHDPRSLSYAIAGQPVSALKSVKWERRIPILDQSDLHAQGIHVQGDPSDPDALGSCVGNTMADWVGTDNSVRQGLTQLADGQAVDELFGIQCYEAATELDGMPGNTYPTTDGGSSGLGGVKALQKAGLCSRYLHAFSVQAIATALQYGPVAMGTIWTESMFNPDAGGYLTIEGDPVGGHEWLIAGFDVDSREFLAVNHWTATWGLDGLFKLKWDQLETLMDDNGDAKQPIV